MRKILNDKFFTIVLKVAGIMLWISSILNLFNMLIINKFGMSMLLFILGLFFVSAKYSSEVKTDESK